MEMSRIQSNQGNLAEEKNKAEGIHYLALRHEIEANKTFLYWHKNKTVVKHREPVIYKQSPDLCQRSQFSGERIDNSINSTVPIGYPFLKLILTPTLSYMQKPIPSGSQI